MRRFFSIISFASVLLLLTFRIQAQVPGMEWVRTFPNVASPNIILPIDIVTDGSGNVYTTGLFYNTRDFDPGPGTFNLTSAGNKDIFVSKLNAAGGLVWAVRIGGTTPDEPAGIAIDDSGKVYITGGFSGTMDFDPGPGVTTLTGPGSFVCKLNASGGFVWARRTGPFGTTDITIDTFGDVVTTGSFSASGDFDPGAGVVTLTPIGSTDIFVSKINSTGDLVWVKQMGGTLGDGTEAITTDISGNIYTIGSFASTADFDPDIIGTSNLTSGGLDDIFISKLSSAGVFGWVKQIGGTGYDRAESITLDGSGNILSTGSFATTVDFDPGGPVFNITSSGPSDVFVSKLDPAGTFIWAKAIEGGAHSLDIATDASDNVFTTGHFDTIVDFDPGAGVFNVTPFMSPEAFISKLDAAGNFEWVVTPRGTVPGWESQGETLSVDMSGNILAAGWFESLVDFDPSACDEILTAASDDIYIWKLNPSIPLTTNCAPTITSFSPGSGTIGSSVTITGTNFSLTAANNVVYFGATRATVTASSKTQLTVTVPTGATYQPISVMVNGLTGFSNKPFLMTFPDGGTIDACSFTSPLGFGPDSGGFGVAMGDLDGDGKTDVAVTDAFANSIRVFRNTSTPGTIDASSFAPSVNFGVGLNPNEVSIADIDGDGKLDIIASSWNSSTISIFRNTSTVGSLTAASFAARLDLPTGSAPYKISCQDLDGDGKTDIAVGNAGGGAISIWQNIGSPGSITAGSFNPRLDIAGPSAGFAIADMDVDGKPDLIAGYNLGSSIGVSRNISSPGTLTTGSFAPYVNFAVAAWPNNLVVGDLDADNRPDVVTSSAPGNMISILKNTSTPGTIGAGSFNPKVDINGNVSPQGVWITDYDGDGLPDIGLSNQTGSVSIYKNANTPGAITTASFLPKVNLPPTGNARGMMSGDIDGDGKPDILVAEWGSPSLMVQRNTVSSLPPPTITNFSPSSGPIGTTVIITGTNFSGASLLNNTIKFNGVTATVLDATSTTITTQVPAGATTGTISVTVGCNTVTSSGNFTLGGPCVPSIERDALIALYNTTDGPNWIHKTNWLSADVSTWEGVTVTGCNVTALQLDENNLSGPIPFELGDLSMLQLLNLRLNGLNGPIPAEIGGLNNLQYLNLSYNNLSGDIPVELENLGNIIDVFLNNNQFTGDAPAVGINSMNASRIKLQDNQLINIPDFTSYYNLSEVDVSSNALTFEDLEPNIAVSGFSYSPQAKIPPGGIFSFLPGGTLTIPFTTPGTGNSYQWFKDGAPIPGATAATLVRPGMAAGDAGSYVVKITSSIVTGLTLESLAYTVIPDPCPPGPGTSGGLDASFAPLINAPSYFYGIGTQTNGKIIAGTDYTIVNSIVTSGILRFNSDGSLDPAFAGNSYGPFLLVQPDDRILAASGPGNLVRLLADGTNDPSFTPTNYLNATIYSVALQPDGKIVVSVDENGTTFLDRLNANGTDDPSFSASITLPCSAIKVQSDGMIIVADQFGGVFRLVNTGAIDPGFNTTGVNNTSGFGNFVTDMAIQPDGKIIAVGLYSYFSDLPHGGIVRLLPDGSLDNTFNPFGISDPLASGSFFYRVTLQPDGKILLGGIFETLNGTNRKNLARLNADGSVDCSFNPGLSTDDMIYGMSLQTDGKILITGGFTSYDGTQRYGLARVNNIGGGATISITLQPSDAIVCDGSMATFSTAATGTTNITYQWQFSPDGIAPFTDIVNGSGYSNATTAILSINTSGAFGAGRYRCRINGDLAAEVKSFDEGLFINPVPPAPAGTGASSCSAASLTLTAAGAINGQYRWYTVSTGGTAVAGEVNTTYLTPTLAATTTYYVSINNGTCESATRTAVTATINTPPAAPSSPIPGSSCGPGNVTVSVSGGVNGQYRWYTVPTGGTAISAEFNDTYTSFALGTTTIYYAAINNGTCESATRTAVTATINTIPPAPASPIPGSVCGTGNVTVSVSGATAGQYRWYTVPTGGTAIPGEVNGSYTVVSLSSTTTYYAAINISSCENATRTAVIATINPVPSPPGSPVPGNSCVPASVAVSVSGGVNGQYRWYTVATGGTPIAGEVNGTYVTPVLASTTSYFVSINDGTCESARTSVTGNINTVPKPPLVTSNCTTTSATLSGPPGFTTYAWSNGATTQQITVNTPGSYTLVVTAASGCISPASDPTVFTATFCNQSPAIAPTSVSTVIEGSVSISLSNLLTDPDNNLDLSTLKVTQQPASGAVASIGPNATLLLDYKGTSFAGTDKLTIEVCDLSGVCSQQVITIEVAGEIVVNTGISPNGDTKNDTWFIQYIEVMPDTKNNKVSVFNRWGDAVFETTNYDNVNRVFTGLNKSGNELPTGTYFYKIEFASGKKALTGYLSLKR